MKKINFFLVTVLFLISTYSFAQDAIMLKYNLQAEKTYTQRVTTLQNVVQLIMGQSIKSYVSVKGDTDMHIEKIDNSGCANILYTIKNFSVRTESMGRDTTINFKNANNKISVTVNTSGKNSSIRHTTAPETKKIPGIEELAKNLKFMVLPNKKIKIGEEWKETQTDTMKPSPTNPFLLIAKQDLEHKLIGQESKNGKEYIKILSKGNITISGKGAQMGMEMLIEGNGKFEAESYSDPKTMLMMYSEANMENDMTISMAGQQNIAIPMTQTSKTIVVVEEKKK